MLNPLLIYNNEGYINSNYYDSQLYRFSYMPYLAIPGAIAKVRAMEIPDITLKTIPAWTSTEKPPENYGEEGCSISTKNIKVIDFYVDSVSIEDLTIELFEAGEGSKEKPFRCLSYALYVLKCTYDNVISAMCDVYMVLHIRGRVDYFDGNVRKKLPETEKFIPFVILEKDYRDFFDHLIYDFDGCDIFFDTYFSGGLFTPSIWAFLCINMRASVVFTPEFDHMFYRTKMLYKCVLDLECADYITLGAYYVSDSPSNVVYDSQINMIQTQSSVVYFRPCIVCSKVNSKVNLLNIYEYDYNDTGFLLHAYRSEFEINGGYYTSGMYDCVVKQHSLPRGWGLEVYNVLHSTITAVRTEEDYLDVYMGFIANSKISLTNASNYSIGRAIASEFTFTMKNSRIPSVNLLDSSNSTFNIKAVIPIEEDYGWRKPTFFATSFSVHVNSKFTIDSTWTGNDKSKEISMYGMYNNHDDAGVSTLHNCTLTCIYKLPSEYYNFKGYSLYYKSTFNVFGGSIWEGACITGPGEKDYIAKCKKECIESGRDDCDERCKSYCEEYGDGILQ